MNNRRKNLLEKRIAELTARREGLETQAERWEVDAQIQRVQRELQEMSKPHYFLAFVCVCASAAVFLLIVKFAALLSSPM